VAHHLLLPEVDLSPQYSTKSPRLRKIIVQLVTIKVIPDI